MDRVDAVGFAGQDPRASHRVLPTGDLRSAGASSPYAAARPRGFVAGQGERVSPALALPEGFSAVQQQPLAPLADADVGRQIFAQVKLPGQRMAFVENRNGFCISANRGVATAGKRAAREGPDALPRLVGVCVLCPSMGTRRPSLAITASAAWQ